MTDPFKIRSVSRTVKVMTSPFSLRAREAREWWGFTQEEAAYDLGVSRTQLTNLESGRYIPSMGLFVRMCDLYDVSADWLLGWASDD